jgi:hypothetical protein
LKRGCPNYKNNYITSLIDETELLFVPGKTEIDPTAKATISVTEVIVMATPD